MANNYYIYLHKKVTDGSVFYVGKGRDDRAWWFHGRSEYWTRVKNKHGVEVEIYKDSLTEDEAYKLEVLLIKEFGRDKLCNHTDGGPGMHGYVFPPYSKVRTGEHRLGRKHTKESRDKMSRSRRGVPKTPEHVENQAKTLRGRPFTEEHKRNLSESIKARGFDPEWGVKSGKARMKKVLCINNGVIYESTKQAASDLGVLSDSVSRVATGKYKHTKGYKFRYIDNEDTRTND